MNKKHKKSGDTDEQTDFEQTDSSNNPFANEQQPQTDENIGFEQIKSDFDALNNQYLRLAADFDNYRKRQAQERESLLRYGTEEAFKGLLEVLDNFERAKKALENIDDAQQVKESLDMLNKQTVETLQKLGLEVIETKEAEFDPNFHEAVMQTPTNEFKEYTIINELQKGYKYADKIIRPALVNVAVSE